LRRPTRSERPLRAAFWLRLTVAVAAAALLVPVRLDAQASAASEYQIKAVFLFNFAQFVEWPPDAFASPSAPLVIGILGDDPFGGSLDATIRGETVNGHPLIVRRYERVDQVTDCHILFVGRGERAQLSQILGRLENRGILTVGDADGFAERGGMIGFVNERNRIGLNINLEASASSNLTLSSKLLRAARIVASGGA
jgi:hypothetical protein